MSSVRKYLVLGALAIAVVACFVVVFARGAATATAHGRSATLPQARRSPQFPSPVVASTSATRDRTIATLALGSGKNQLGARQAQESNPEGPMALVAQNGELAVLDQVNSRIVRLGPDGTPIGTIPIGPDTAQDIAIGPDGRVAVLDRVTDAQLLYYDQNGTLVGSTPVIGGPIDESGGATGVFVDDRGVYIEREHGETVRVLGADGQPDPDRPTLPGRPLRDGSGSMQAFVVSKPMATTTLRAFDQVGDLTWQRTVRFPSSILSLVMLDSDRAGHMYLAAHVASEDPTPPYALTNERIIVVRVDEKTGANMGSLVLPPPPGADEALRPLSVGDDGTVYQMLTGANGVQIHAYAFP